MFIAFEGPDNVGKSTSAANLSSEGVAVYNVTKDKHAVMGKDIEPDQVVTYDRIDWFTHMIYRLALPDAEWNDARARTVFAMPDTHLVIKMHRPELADFTADEVVHTPISQVNPMYFYFAEFLSSLNRARHYSLFKSISIIEVTNDELAGVYSQRLVSFDSAAFSFLDILSVLDRLVDSDESLLEMLRYVDSRIG